LVLIRCVVPKIELFFLIFPNENSSNSRKAVSLIEAGKTTLSRE